MEQKDYYEILGLEQNVTTKQIKNAYRKLALQYHPDRNRDDPTAADKMKAVNEAYAVLSNPQKRNEYDAIRQQFGSSAYTRFRQTYSEQDIFSGSDINRIFEEIARSFGLRGFDEIFKEFYGQGYRTFEFKQPGFTARGFMFTGPFGGKNQNSTAIPTGGVLGKLSRHLFKKISGIELPENGRDIDEIIYLSPEQANRGGPHPYLFKKKLKKLMITIPSGVRDGQKIRLSGMGEDGTSGGKSGDLYLKVHIKKPLLEKLSDLISCIRN
ncbi:MAG: DnaJ domain-containing protein [Deltaproteobacteria bacterium]|nr:DnaJ domain-containing protein [Deltaproteobacteria bacterium]